MLEDENMKNFAKNCGYSNIAYFANVFTHFGLYHQNRMTYITFNYIFVTCIKNPNWKRTYLHKNKICDFSVFTGRSKILGFFFFLNSENILSVTIKELGGAFTKIQKFVK